MRVRFKNTSNRVLPMLKILFFMVLWRNISNTKIIQIMKLDSSTPRYRNEWSKPQSVSVSKQCYTI